MHTITNPAIDRMRNNEAALGMIVRLSRTAEIAKVAAASGHDFLFIDAQHGPFSLETISDIAQAAVAEGIAGLVRVRGSADPDIGRILDAGASGIVVPDVETAEQAREAVMAARFAPLGRRSVSGSYASLGFRPVPVGEASVMLNTATLVVCMIETARGMDAIETIAAVEGVDVLHLGANDLLSDMGMPGQFDAPEFTALKNRFFEVCGAHGRWAGFGGDRDLGRQKDAIARGARFVTTNTDLGYLLQAASAKTASLR
ncbi:MAG TPA: aldolase/citrate lyase family protein [Pelagibacterium sp.]|uniref:HpcH/HpaI aldolase family protein n=1 Tax=Pelagibacterium sp. TaxID=1967288 RepID=UPI002C0BFB7D|nr:aldolase/citrate lyase family protein [Pelagibacterium sp.]HWJ87107.1 aldolase/citrate lyase family protein [Pelagibacterium sp.]